MSKEMIHSKLKAKKLNYIIENGTTYIIVSDSASEDDNQTKPEEKTAQMVPQALSRPKTTVATVLALYQRENRQLKDKIIQLEAKIDKLIDDKEQMLRYERDKIEEIYSAKDEQLKNILELVNKKFILEQKPQTIHEVETFNTQKIPTASEEDESGNQEKVVELRDYLKTLDLKSHQRKIIKRRFYAAYDNDVRIMQQNGKLYLDFSKYDYSDLLSY